MSVLQSFFNKIIDRLNSCVKFVAQSLTNDQKAIARSNIDAEQAGAAAQALADAKTYTNTAVSSKADSSALSDMQEQIDAKVPTTRTVNGKTLSANISLSASDVGADASGTASAAVSTHNTSTSAHNDIRDLIGGLTTRLNALADSDDTTLDQMSEVVAYIKSNKSLIDSITTSKVNVADIINNLTTNVTNKPLSAAQGVVIKALIDALQSDVDSKAEASALTSHTGNTSNPHNVTLAQLGAQAKLTGTAGQVVGFDANGNAVAQEAPSGGGSVQSDWNQNDETAADFIKNRTHWTEDPITTTEVTIEENTFVGFSGGMYQGGASYNFVSGAECTVTWDGVEYTCTTEEANLDIPYITLGNPAILGIEENAEDNGQPFGMAYAPDGGMIIILSNDQTATSHVIKVVSTYTAQKIHKIDNKYIDAEWMAAPPIGYDAVADISETTMTSVEDNGLYTVGIEHDMPNIVNGAIVHFILDGTEYNTYLFFDDDSGYFGNVNMLINGEYVSGDPYCALVYHYGVQLILATGGDHTFSLRMEVPVYKQLPAYYIQDALSNVKPNIIVDSTPTSGSNNPISSGGVYNVLLNKANTSHNQSASTITFGTFAGQVVANSSCQTYSTSLLRNSKLVSTDTNPSNNGEIYWTYA